jgi:hypothetical protein
MSKTEDLINQLSTDLAPVRRLRPPLVRAVMWLIGVGLMAGTAIALLADLGSMAQRVQNPDLALELIGTGLTGVLAIIAAFHLAIPGRSPLWALAPAPALALWLLVSGLGCYQDWIVRGDQVFVIGESFECFLFMLGVSLPLAAMVILALRCAKPIAPAPVAALGGLGVAALSALILQFFHPFSVTLVDLVFHLGAVLLIIAYTTGSTGIWRTV